MPKSDPVSAIRIGACVFVKLVCVGRAGEQRIRHCHGENSIISESALGHEQRKVLRFLGFELVNRSNDVASNGSQHFSGILSSPNPYSANPGCKCVPPVSTNC